MDGFCGLARAARPCLVSPMPTLNWIGKEAVIKHHREVPYRLLEPEAGLGLAGEDGTGGGNLIVEGDNLHALKALLPRYAGQVKCIYIDPPYNTGNEGWVYNDNVKAPEIVKWLGETVGKEAEDLSRHDKWLCMMYPRLVLLKQFLREDGAIFVSIDDNEVASLRLLMDEIFGRGNFVANVVWEKSYTPNQTARFISNNHDHLLVYCRSEASYSMGKLTRTEEQKAKFRNPDNDPRGAWKAENLSAGKFYSAGQFPIIGPTGETFYPPHGRYWRMNEEQFGEWFSQGRITFGLQGTGRPMLKKYLNEMKDELTASTWWANAEVGSNKEASIELKSVLLTDSFFATPKPTRLIQRILQIATDKDSLIIDSFAGSGTTGHAVLKQNAEDGGTRRFLLVEMEPGIARDITAERVRRVAAGYKDAKGKAVPGLGGGFQYCRLSAEPLFNEHGDIRDDVTYAQLADFVWFAETGTGYTGKGDSPLLGVHEERAVYLLFNGILGDRRPDGGNILTRPVLDSLPVHEGPRTIYAAATRLGEAALRRAGITFKQTPYAIGV